MIKLLIVDDEPQVGNSLKDFFEEKKYEVHLAYDAEDALRQAKTTNPHLVFLDIGLPGLSGLEILPRIKGIEPTTRVIMITGLDDPQKMKEAFQKGASDYITKPFNVDYLQTVVLGKVYAQLFEDLRKEHEELLRAYERLFQMSLGTIQSLAKALEEKDPYTRGHSERVTQYALEIAQELGLGQTQIKLIFQAGLLHDIGKIGITDGILNKPAKLTPEEWEKVKSHPEQGAEIVKLIADLKEHTAIIRHHHERWNGQGYPDGLKEENIPLLSRILALADAYDAMTSSRPYRPALSSQEAVKELVKEKGSQFDPQAVDAFISVLKKKGIIT